MTMRSNRFVPSSTTSAVLRALAASLSAFALGIACGDGDGSPGGAKASEDAGAADADAPVEPDAGLPAADAEGQDAEPPSADAPSVEETTAALSLAGCEKIIECDLFPGLSTVTACVSVSTNSVRNGVNNARANGRPCERADLDACLASVEGPCPASRAELFRDCSCMEPFVTE